MTVALTQIVLSVSVLQTCFVVGVLLKIAVAFREDVHRVIAVVTGYNRAINVSLLTLALQELH